MKWVSLVLVVVMIAGGIGISGCTSNSTKDPIINKTSYSDIGTDISRGQVWNSTYNEYETVWTVSIEKKSSSFNKEDALKELSTRKPIEQNYSKTIEQDTKTLNGVTIYYLSWVRQHQNIYREIFFFEKNGTWYKMDIEDRTGNNTNAINNEIATYMNKV